MNTKVWATTGAFLVACATSTAWAQSTVTPADPSKSPTPAPTSPSKMPSHPTSEGASAPMGAKKQSMEHKGDHKGMNKDGKTMKDGVKKEGAEATKSGGSGTVKP